MFILLHLFPLYEDKHFFLEFYIAKEMLTHHIFMTSSHFICIFGITPVYLPNSNSCATEVFIINKAEWHKNLHQVSDILENMVYAAMEVKN